MGSGLTAPEEPGSDTPVDGGERREGERGPDHDRTAVRHTVDATSGGALAVNSR